MGFGKYIGSNYTNKDISISFNNNKINLSSNKWQSLPRIHKQLDKLNSLILNKNIIRLGFQAWDDDANKYITYWINTTNDMSFFNGKKFKSIIFEYIDSIPSECDVSLFESRVKACSIVTKSKSA